MSAHPHHHESHGNHPMSFVGFVLVLVGFACAAVWLVSMAGGNVMPAVIFGLLMVAAFAGAVSIFMSLVHRNHHSPILPDSTPDELSRYMHEYRD